MTGATRVLTAPEVDADPIWSTNAQRSSRFDLGAAVAIVIARLATSRGWSSNDLADHARLPRTSLARRLRGLGTLDVGEVEAIAAALQVDPLTLFAQARQLQLTQVPAPAPK